MPSQGRSEDERGSVIAPAVQSNLTVAAPLQRRCQAGGSVAQFNLSAGRCFCARLATMTPGMAVERSEAKLLAEPCHGTVEHFR